MLSILVYGRNDSHGYNLHKRVALSLNAIAPLLSEPSDEIVFVDYNTPSDLPTFVDAIRDTLTSDALARLRVIRVPPWVHQERFADRTRLAALEPVARNVGLRRSNPANKWVLSTNTDMLFVPHKPNRSLTDIVAELDDGYYALPRYDIPEALWESMDRRDPATNVEQLREWGPQLHLDSIVLSFPYNGFDAPGDFQLIRRDKLCEIDAFDEEMLHGWHVDSNIFKRLSLVYGTPGDLSPELSGYHCDHTRLATAVHRTGGIQNDLHRFVENVDRPDVPAQRDTWGLPDLELHEVDLRSEATTRFSTALARVVPPARDPVPVVNSLDSFERMDYDPAHVLPYLVDPLTVLPADSTLAYVGVNAGLAEMLALFLRELGFTKPLHILDIKGAPHTESTAAITLAELATRANAVVFDFGLLPPPGTEAPAMIGGWSRPVRWRLSRVLEAFDQLVVHDLENQDIGNPRRYLAVNSRATLFEAFFTSRLVTTTTPYNTRTQHGFVAEIPPEDVAAVFTPAVRAALGSFFGYGLNDGGCRYPVGSVMDFTIAGEAGRYENDGWSLPEVDGTWTAADVVDLVFELVQHPGGAEHGYVCSVESQPFLVAPDHTRLDVEARLNGTTIGTLAFEAGVASPAASAFLVDREVVESVTPSRLELVVRTPRSPAELGLNRDARRLGVKVRSVVVRARELRLALGERARIGAGAVADWLAAGWSHPESTGTWTEGRSARLLVVPTGVPSTVAVELALEVRDAMLTAAHPGLDVEVRVDGVTADHWTLRHDGPRHHIRRVPLPPTGGTAPVEIEFLIDAPASPLDLGLGPDTRDLGFMLSALTLVRAGAPDPPIATTPATLVTRVRSRAARLRSDLRARFGGPARAS